MLFESAHARVAAEYGTATLWLGFPGEPVNALDLARLRELDAALAAAEANPALHTLVVRSAKPAGFCAGVHPEALASLPTAADRAAFSWAGQRVLDRLARLPFPTVAFIDGPCLGAGLELALACTFRLCVARPTTHLGFPDAPRGVPACLGGSVRLRQRVGRRVAEQLLGSGRTLSGREARRLGLVDHAFCERRAKIELRTFLDGLERSQPVGREPQGGTGYAAERRAFARAAFPVPPPARLPASLNPVPPLPAVVGLVGDDEDAARVAAEVALRGGEVVVSGDADGVLAGIEVALARGFVTPLEARQARARVTVVEGFAGFDRCGLVLTDARPGEELLRAVRPRCLVATVVRPGVVRPVRRDPDAVAALTAWLRPFGLAVAVPVRLPAVAAA